MLQETPHAEHLFAVRLMQHLVVPTFVLNANGQVMIWNNACERLTGIKAKELIGTKNHWQAFYQEPRECLADLVIKNRPEDLAKLYPEHSNPFDNTHGVSAENWCHMPRAEKRLYLAIDAGPIYDEAGHLIAVVETLRDMTEHKLAQNELQHLAHKDGLTSLANRRAFDIQLEDEWQHARQSQNAISLLLMDVDRFKRFNDIYGHRIGDECLKKVADVIASQAKRTCDLAARYGGEEFAIILPGVDSQGAIQVAERVRQSVFDLRYAHSGSSHDSCVTISIGVASMIPDFSEAASKLVDIADQALYQAKADGRNRAIYQSELSPKEKK